MTPDLRCLGLDIGGTTTKAVCCTTAGGVLGEAQWPSLPPDGGDAAAWCTARLRDWLDAPVLAVGVAICGLIDQQRGTMVHAPNARGLEGWGYRDQLQARCQKPVALLNDAKAFVYGEWSVGAGQGAAHCLGVTLGTGIGSGLILEKQLYLGAHGWPGELGHIPLDPAGPPCLCGLAGCLEAYIREAALVQDYNASLTDPRTAVTNGASIIERAGLGDPAAIAAWERYGHYLGTTLAGVITLLDLPLVILGGGLAPAFDWLHPALMAAMNAGLSRPEERQVTVRSAQLGRHAGAIGAALYAARET